MMNSLLTTILGLDLKDFLLHLFNFLLLVTIVGLLVYKPVIRFVRARKEGIEKQEKEHNEKNGGGRKDKVAIYRSDRLCRTRHRGQKEGGRRFGRGESGGDFSGSEAPRGKDFTGGRRRGEKRKVKAITAMKGEVAEVAVMIASGILDKEITPEENAKIIDDCLKEWDESHD